jgi:N-acetylglucosamine repressor
VVGIKVHNLQTILLTLLYHGAISRARLAQLTGLSTAAVSHLVADLVGREIVAEEGREPTLPAALGRPRTAVRLLPSARYAVGVHIDVDLIRVTTTNLLGELQQIVTSPHIPGELPNDTIERIAALSEDAIAALGVPRSKVVGIGVGATGLVDTASGINILAPNLGWRDVPIRSLLQRRLQLPAFVDNNMRAMALGEAMFGHGADVDSVAFVYAHIGVGAGFIFDHRAFRGSHAGAGEIGHTTVVHRGGLLCSCGNTGCLETLVSEPAVVRQALRAAADNPDSQLAALFGAVDQPSIKQVVEAAQLGDCLALELLRQSADYLGTALANLVDVINPDLIILGGWITSEGGLMLAQIEETMRRRAFASLGEHVALQPATFGSLAGAIGAAAMALDTFFYRGEHSPLALGVRHLGMNPDRNGFLAGPVPELR